MLIDICGGLMYWAPGISNPIQRAYELGNQSPVLSELRGPRIVFQVIYLSVYQWDCDLASDIHNYETAALFI